MVTPTARRDRGQVILIGAITLAFILLGIVVVFNGVLYTETLSSSATSQSAADADMTVDGIERNLVEIAHRGNMNGAWDPYPKFYFNDNITGTDGFRDQYRNTTANSRAAITTVSVDSASITDADVVVENETTGNISFGSGSKVGYFVLNLDDGTDGDKLTVKTNTTGDSVTIERHSDGFSLDSVPDGNCEISDGQVQFNLVTGKTNITPSSPCDHEKFKKQLSIIESYKSYPNSNPEIAFSGNDDLGSYTLVAADITDTDDIPSDKKHDGVLSFDATVTYESNQVSYKRDSTVEIYGDNR